MKKIIILSMFLFSSIFSFAAWEVLHKEDEFGDKTGEIWISLNSLEDKGRIVISPASMAMHSGEILGKNLTKGSFKIKIDKNDIISSTGMIIGNGDVIIINGLSPIYVYDQIFSEMKNGKVLKISFTKFDGTTFLKTFDLNGFTEAFKQVKSAN